jgi:predicted nucleotide-binding protein
VELDDVRERLRSAGYAVKSEGRLGNHLGDQLRLEGAVVNVFDKGTVQVQGKDPGLVDALRAIVGVDVTQGDRPARSHAVASPQANREVLVVYGHELDARTQLEARLRRWNLEPLILAQLPSEGATLIEKLEKYAREDVGFAVVLATPDDVGNANGKDDERKFRARQNVVLELGLLLAKLGRARVAILLKDQAAMERPSDLQGLIYLAFTDDVDEVKLQLAKEMHRQGIAIDVARV